jgi:hypothetical protein
MGRFREWAFARPRVLLVDAPGGTALRWSVEAELDCRGWPHAVSPADTDLLVVLGKPGPELAEAVELLWTQVPAPRHRVDLSFPADIAAALDAGGDGVVRRVVASAAGDDRPSPASLLGKDGHTEGMDHGGGHAGMDHGGGHAGMEDGDAGHEGHHMHHGGEVAGLPMAMSGPDRDGLELDVLKVALGPVLPGWPTGVVLRADLLGDVLTSVELSWLDADSLPATKPDLDPQRAALDRLSRFLVVAGWPTAARDARRARDGIGGGDRDRRAAAQRLAVAVTRRVRRSRTLAWTAGGIGQTAPERGAGPDVLDRVRSWCDAGAGHQLEASVSSLDDVPALVEGTEIGSARLIVASLHLEPVAVAPQAGSTHA